MNWQLFSVIWSITSTTAMGVFMIIALVIGYDDIPDIISVVVAGLVVSIPISYVLTNKINRIRE